ncbi:Ig-like domain-containing protein [Terriglobus roseus]|uniref:Ig-like domain (Group 3) n=1 Tax=Terriglobus roseus TaxID=392734 RepID=A0A1G7HYK9_9BACT|nr:Ig-like domain-containing protein [Terriglobus roseus]SDF05562.1 Ig-like domain (group 3) [Terriglobus roseus]
MNAFRLRQFSSSFLMTQLMIVLSIAMPLAAQSSSPQSDTAPITRLQISSTSASSGSAVVNIKIPSSAGSAALKVHLNGHDVGARFTSGDCSNATCKTATLAISDGLHTAKNVLTVDAGNGLTSRLRFDAQGTSASAVSAGTKVHALSSMSAQAVSSGIATPFVPPTLTFSTNNAGGWKGSGFWFTIGTQQYPVATPTNCTGATYLVEVLDRQTLAESTSTPPQCQASASALNTYLKTLNSGDLVVLGTLQGKNADAGLDTSPIGGSNHGGSIVTGYPAGYMAIGVGQAAAGTAYEPYYTIASGYEPVPPFANGTLQEDAYGNYNFQASQVVEYTVSPNDPSYLTANNTSVVSIQNLNGGSIQFNVYSPTPGSANGYWLLTVSRNSLNTYPYACTPSGTSQDGTTMYFSGCGKFYNTGNSDATVAQAAYASLATDLSSVNSWQLAFLTTVGQPAYGTTNWDVAGFTSYGGTGNGYQSFTNAIAQLGGTPGLTESLLSPTSAYTLIASPGIGGPLAGGAVESTTQLAAQGQTGLVHGILERNLNGLFQPEQTNQETFSLFQAKGGVNSPEFKLTEAALQQPVDWPSSSSGTVLKTGTFTADTTAGQVAAYRYLSYILIAKVYFPGISPTALHLDDIHYFFTGSLNTTVNYHTFDVRTIQWPTTQSSGMYAVPCDSVSGNTCTVNIFGQNDPLVFTQNDFQAVQAQLFNEIVYLTNTLQFMVTGSTNMKDVVAAGSSNAGIALTGAASSILGSKLLPAPPATVIKTSWQNIVSMLGGVASLASAFPGYGSLLGIGEDTIKALSAVTTATGGIAGIAAGAGQITSSDTSSSLPSSFAHFATTIGNLANGSMQGQLSSGFDTVTDSITSDWGRLSIIGPMTIDPSNTVFYAPNQVGQTVAIQSLTQAASRSFYLALLPSFYSVQYWQGVSGDRNTPGNNIPDMGYFSSDGNSYYTYFCSAFYLNPQKNSNPAEPNDPLTGLGTIAANTSVWYPSVSGTPQNFQWDYSKYPIDYYVIGGTVANSGSDSPFIQTLDPTLGANLFTTAGLNMPIDEFVTQQGPMSSVWDNAATTNPAGHRSDTVCNARIFPTAGSGNFPVEPGYGKSVSTVPPAISEAPTTTLLTAPTTSVYGSPVVISAKVATTGGPVTVGEIYFQDNGVTIATVSLDSTGTASATLAMSAGTHSLQAKYGRVDPYATSSSAIAVLNVYGAAPDLNLSLSGNTLSSTSGSTSQALTLQITSLAGLSGQVAFNCSGLPVGMTCNFTPASTMLAANGTATSSFTVSGTVSSKSSVGAWNTLWLSGLSALGLLSLSVGFRKRSALASKLLLVFGVGIFSMGALTGCAGSSSGNTQQPAVVTMQVIATSGSVSRSLPVTITVQ